MYKELQNMIEKANNITIITHINPDADTLGTALGIYALFHKEKGKKVEIANASKTLPIYLDFLPNYKRIKNHIDYDNSLVITCDCGSIDRLGFDVSGYEIINIDHHASNTKYGTLNIVVPEYAAASQVAFEAFKSFRTISKDAAICFYAALLSDSQYFTTSSVNKEVFGMAQSLIELGANPANIAFNFKQRKSLSSLRLLARVLHSLTLHNDAKISTIMIRQEDINATGASVSDMDGIVDYAKSLATVQIAICLTELSSSIRVSIRSKVIDISSLALYFGGGGHKLAAGFSLEENDLEKSMDKILKKIYEMELINGK